MTTPLNDRLVALLTRLRLVRVCELLHSLLDDAMASNPDDLITRTDGRTSIKGSVAANRSLRQQNKFACGRSRSDLL